MIISFSWWVLLVLAVLAFTFYIGFYDDSTISTKLQVLRGFLVAVVVLALMNMTGLTSFVFVEEGESTTSESVSDTTVVADVYGFEWNKTYPLSLGAKVTGFTSDVNVSSFIFTDATASVQGGSAISVGFEHNGKSWSVAVPTATNTIRVSTTEAPSVTLRADIVRSRAVTYQGTKSAPKYTADCDLRLHNFLIGCVGREVTVGEYGPISYDEKAVQKGLASYLEPLIQSSEMVMTPDMRDRLEGRIN